MSNNFFKRILIAPASMKRSIKIVIHILLVLCIFVFARFFRESYFISNSYKSAKNKLPKSDNYTLITPKYLAKTNTVRSIVTETFSGKDSATDRPSFTLFEKRETDNSQEFQNLHLAKFLFNNSFKSHGERRINSSVHNNDYGIVKKEDINDNTLFKKKYEVTFKNKKNNEFQGFEIYGTADRNRSYAVFSTTTDSRDSMSFIFYLPLTVLAWKRVGFSSLIIIVGSRLVWIDDPLLSFVLKQLTRLKAIIIFLESDSHMSIMLSQISRIYAGNILYSQDNFVGDIYLLTSDADIWPLKSGEFKLPDKKLILSLNADCCTPFKHRGRVYRMLPMSNIGMRVNTWIQLTNRLSVSPSSIDEIMTQIVREFGSVALRPIHKGDNVGWFLDQMLISTFIAQWNDLHPASVKYTSRDVSLDRIDRSAWKVGLTIDDKLDAHLPADGYKPHVWKEITPLLDLMYDGDSKESRYCKFYHKKFTMALQENGAP